MKKCIDCGKNGLFLKLDYFGRCKDCGQRYIAEQEKIEKEKAEQIRMEKFRCEQLEKEQREKKMAETQAYLNNVATILYDITHDIEQSPDPIERLEYIPAIEKERIPLCDDLYNLMCKYKDYEYIMDIIRNNLEDHYSFGTYKPFDVLVLPNDTADTIFDKIIINIPHYKAAWQKKIERIKSDAAFQKILLDLPTADIILSTLPDYKKNRRKYGELWYPTITAKSNYDKLGTFVVLDTETTGLDPNSNEIIELAAVYFENWVPKLKFETLIKPSTQIPEKITEITGINDTMVSNSPAFSDVITAFNDFIGDNNIVGHNLDFDLSFLFACGYDFRKEKRKYYDTLAIARKMLKKPGRKYDKELGYYTTDYDKDYDVENHKLNTLCEYYKIRDNQSAHRASSDALATGFLFQNLVRKKLYL